MNNIFPWLEIILKERFGCQFTLKKVGHNKLSLTCLLTEGAIIFDRLEAAFFDNSSDIPFEEWDAVSEGWSSILDKALPAPSRDRLPSPLIEKDGLDYIVHFDILGLTYWMLSRQEEVGATNLDVHGRFPATASHAYRHGYLDRPIVDEWLAVLRQVISRLWPMLPLKEHQFKVRVSHDVDSPSRYGFRTPLGLIRGMAADVLKHRDFAGCMKAPWVWINTRKSLSKYDPYNTFDWLMDISEKNGLKSAFYFMCGRTDKRRDGDYEIEHPSIRSLMRRIHERGHEIGLHPSYNTYKHPRAIVGEAIRLKRICDEEGIRQQEWGGRMHYLRCEIPTTLYGWEEAGMSYDSTLGYADHPGFRCGTCHENPAFDPVKKRILNIRIRPLVIMECSVLSAQYLGLDYPEEALELMVKLKRYVMRVGGDLTLLWHNSNLVAREHRQLYKAMILS